VRFKLLLPTEVFVNEEVRKVIAEAENGFFCLLPRHVDCTAALFPGLLIFEKSDGEEEFLGVDEGILVKRGSEVLVSTRNAVRVDDLGDLKQTILEQFRTLDDRERSVRSAVAKLEANLVRRFMGLK
jgi:F-type H+-transporting ATPase subunit epsilon